jgi:hypothetical protein
MLGLFHVSGRIDQMRPTWLNYLMLMLAIGAYIASSAYARPGQQSPANGRPCTADGLIHAEVSPDITERVTKSVKVLKQGSQLREVAKLDLPCGFHLDPRSGWNLVVTDGTEVRRYVENNAFGFAPAFGFSEKATRPYTLNYRPVGAGELHLDGCIDTLKRIKADLQSCSSFGSSTSFFGTTSDGRTTRLSHYVVRDSHLEEDFQVAEISGHIEGISFLASPDSPGGTITLILADDQGMYRAFLDTPAG